MEIKLNNIGIIEESVIMLNGLTVITGSNNSGKTTVGKALYSLVDAVSNIQNKSKNDRMLYIQKQLDKVVTVLSLYGIVRQNENYTANSVSGQNSTLPAILNKLCKTEPRRGMLEQFAHELLDELRSFDVTNIDNVKELYAYYKTSSFVRYSYSDFTEWFDEQRKVSIIILEKLFDVLDKDLELVDYARESINQTLNSEFSHQIQPIQVSVKKSKIELTDKDTDYFRLEVAGNKVVNDGSPVFVSSPYDKTYFIDDPFILDVPPTTRYIRGQEMEENDTLVNARRILTHDNKLKSVLRSAKRPTIFEETVLNETLTDIKKQIDKVIPGEFEFTSDGEYYVQNGKKLQVSNLATGSKMFSIIKILLEKGEIDSSTMLVLDEPEAHLHPSWQNRFAEILVLLVKQLNVTILLTTHSPNFVLAVDAYMRKHDISDKTNFYQTEFMDNGLVRYQCVNDDMGKIYSDFLKYLSEVKMLRNKYTEKSGDFI